VNEICPDLCIFSGCVVYAWEASGTQLSSGSMPNLYLALELCFLVVACALFFVMPQTFSWDGRFSCAWGIHPPVYLVQPIFSPQIFTSECISFCGLVQLTNWNQQNRFHWWHRSYPVLKLWSRSKQPFPIQESRLPWMNMVAHMLPK